MFLSFFRIIKFGFQDVFRNIWLSIATITILVLALFSINMLIVVQVLGSSAVNAVKNKIDISLYIKPNASNEEIMSLKNTISSIKGVKNIDYISKSEALELFEKQYKNKPEILEALKEIGKNPLSPSFIIKPDNSENVNELISLLENIESDIIESRDFSNHSLMLSRINFIVAKIIKVGIVVSLVFIFITLLVIYNTIRVAIYTHRKEIVIMKLVGASNYFVYMPFIVSGMIYAFLGIVLIMSIFYPFLSLLQPYIEVFFIDFNIDIISYFKDNIFYIFGSQLLIVSFINMLASLFAVKRYSKV